MKLALSPYYVHSILKVFDINFILKECLCQQLQPAKPSGLF
jgi:hypothetical protein